MCREKERPFLIFIFLLALQSYNLINTCRDLKAETALVFLF